MKNRQCIAFESILCWKTFWINDYYPAPQRSIAFFVGFIEVILHFRESLACNRLLFADDMELQLIGKPIYSHIMANEPTYYI